MMETWELRTVIRDQAEGDAEAGFPPEYRKFIAAKRRMLEAEAELRALERQMATEGIKRSAEEALRAAARTNSFPVELMEVADSDLAMAAEAIPQAIELTGAPLETFMTKDTDAYQLASYFTSRYPLKLSLTVKSMETAVGCHDSTKHMRDAIYICATPMRTAKRATGTVPLSDPSSGSEKL